MIRLISNFNPIPGGRMIFFKFLGQIGKTDNSLRKKETVRYSE